MYYVRNYDSGVYVYHLKYMYDIMPCTVLKIDMLECRALRPIKTPRRVSHPSYHTCHTAVCTVPGGVEGRRQY